VLSGTGLLLSNTRFEIYPLVVLLWAFVGTPLSRWGIEKLMIKKPAKKKTIPNGEFDNVVTPSWKIKKKKNLWKRIAHILIALINGVASVCTSLVLLFTKKELHVGVMIILNVLAFWLYALIVESIVIIFIHIKSKFHKGNRI